MFKKCLSAILTALLIVTSLPAIALPTFATGDTQTPVQAEGNGADAIAAAFDQSHLVVTNDLTDDGKLGIPVTVKTYADKTLYEELGASTETAMPTTSDGRKYEVIVYIIGHNEERIGQESDVSILTDYLSQGYVVVVLDYKFHELAIASQLEFSIQNIRKQIQTNGTYLGDALKANRPAIKKDCNFALPAGCRLARNIVYYNLLENGIAGTAEQIVKCWNDAGTSSNTFKNAKTSKIPACEYNNNTKGVWYEATSVEQLVRPDPVTGEARALDFNLYLDLVYPSNPTRETPVYMNSSSHEQREGEGVGNGGILQTGLSLRGYTTGIYDHEYFPMARDDHYGYFIGTYGYGMAGQIGVKTHTAAIRCVRYHAAEFGYSEYDGYSVGGGSKASYCSILGSDEPNDRAEISSFSGGPFNTTDYATAGQPWLTYSNESANAGEEISARVEGVISFMGDGTNRHAEIVNADTSASVIACGIYDQFGSWDKWPAIQETYMNYDVPHLAISMYDLGHAWPVGVDSVLKYDRSQAMIEFLYYWANTVNVAPRVIYTSPYNGDEDNKNEDPIVIHFAGDIALTEIQSKVKVIDVTNNNEELTGTWTVSAGNNKFEFDADKEFINGHTYQIVIPQTVTDTRGLSMEKAVTTTFVSAADVSLAAIKDAYIVSGSSTNTGSEKSLMLSGNTKKGYLEFDVSSVKQNSILTRLAIHVENDATNTVEVWALAEDAATWAEDTIVWDNAPAASTLVGAISVSGAGDYMLDITDYVAGLEGNTVRLVLVNKFNSSEVVYDQSFDDLTSFVKGTNSDAVGSYSDTYDFRQGGSPSSVGLSSAEDHTTGSGKCFEMVRNNHYDRFKLYNTIKSSALTEDDIGTTYRITFWAKSSADVTVTAGLMMPQGTYGQIFCGTTSTTEVAANTWTKCELVITLTEDHVTNQAAMLTIQGSGTSTLYVDDVRTEIVGTDVTVSSRESTSAPIILANVNKGAVTIGKTHYETFEAAMQAVPTDGTATTITLQEDVTLAGAISVPTGMNLTIDLGGYTMTAQNLANVSNFTAPVGVKGSLKIGNGNFVCTGSSQYTFHVWGSGTDNGSYLEFMEGLNIDSDAGYGIVQVGSQTANEGSFVMRDGVTVKTVYLLIYTYSGSDATIYGGDVENTVGPMIFCFQGSNEKVIWGGTYKSVPGDLQLFRQVDGLVLKGGTYSEYAGDRNGKLATVGDGYVMVENTDGTYTVKAAEAKIGTTSYLTFAEAVAAVPTDGTKTEITLLKDINIASRLTVATGQIILLNLGGHTATVTDTTKNGPILVQGALSIKNGTLKDALGTARQYTFYVHGDENTKLELLDGAYIDSNADYGTVQLGSSNTKTSVEGEFIMQEGSTLKTAWVGIYAYSGGKVTINGGEIINTVCSYIFCFRSTGTYAAPRVINGGTFTGTNTASKYWPFTESENVTLMGGTFNSQIVNKELAAIEPAEGYKIVDNGDGTYTVCANSLDFMIGDVKYATLEAALAAVPTDGTATTITLLNDVALTSGFTVASGMNLTIDLGGHTMSAENLAVISTAPISVRGSLKLINGTLDISTTATSGYYGIHVFGPDASTMATLELGDGLSLKVEKGSGAIQLGNNSTLGELICREGASVRTYRYFVYAYTGCPVTIYGGTYEDYQQGRLLYLSGTAERVIYGGTFTSNPTDDSDKKLFALAGGLTIYGGTYNEQPAASLIGEDHEMLDNGDGTYTVRAIPRGVMIGDTQYDTIEAAMAAVPTNGTATTITLLDDVTTTSGLLVQAGMNLTIDLAGYTMTLSGQTQAGSSIYGSLGVKGSLKIGNGKLVIDGAKQYGIHIYNTGTNSGAYLEFADGLTVEMVNSVGTHGLVQIGHQNTNSGELVIRENVKITLEYKLIYVYNNSAFTIYGGDIEITKTEAAFYSQGSSANGVILGGSFKTNASVGDYKLFRQGYGIVLFGGTFSEQPLAANAGVPTCGKDRTVVDNGDGTFTVKKLRYVGEPQDFTYVSEAEPDKNFEGQSKVILSGKNGNNFIILAEFDVSDVAGMDLFRIPVCGTADQKISVAVIDGWSFDSATVTYNSVQDKLWAELMTTEKAGKHVGRYTVGTAELSIPASDILSKVTGDTFTLVLQADEKYVFEQNFNDRTEMTISESETPNVIGASQTSLNVIYDSAYMAARGGYTPGCAIAFVNAPDKDGQNSMMFRVTQGGQRYKFYNALGTDKMTVLDIGRTFRISLDVMTTKAITGAMQVSLQCHTNGDGTTSPTAGGTEGGSQYANYASNWRYCEQNITTTANVWQTVSFDVTVDELMVNHQIGILGLNFGSLGSTEYYYYIDNIKVEEINGNGAATETSFPADQPVAFVDDQKIELGENVTVIKTDVTIGTLDQAATTTNLITHNGTALLTVNNQTGALVLVKDGVSYSVCDAKGNVYTVGTDAMTVMAIIDKAAGTVRYAVNDKLAYYLNGETVVNTYATVAVSGGFTADLTVGAESNTFGGVNTANVSATFTQADAPRIVGTQMNTVNNAVRVLAGIDGLYYSAIGFIAERGDGALLSWKTPTVFTSINVLNTTETAESLGCKYLTAFVLKDLDQAENGDTFTVTPVVYVDEVEIKGTPVTYVVTIDGTNITVGTNN